MALGWSDVGVCFQQGFEVFADKGQVASVVESVAMLDCGASGVGFGIPNVAQNVTQRRWLPHLKCYRNIGRRQVGGATVWLVNRQEGLDPNAGRVSPCY